MCVCFKVKKFFSLLIFLSIFQIKIYTLEEQDAISVKVEKQVGSPARVAYHLLSDFTKRPLWDPHYM